MMQTASLKTVSHLTTSAGSIYVQKELSKGQLISIRDLMTFTIYMFENQGI